VITSATSTSASADTALAAGTAAAQPGGALGKDQFLKLLIAQMQNQDPMAPMDGTQMATQLAQFSSLEQLQQINTTLTSQQTSSGSLLGAIQSTAAINTIGHTVVAVGNQVQVGGASGATTVTANLAGASSGGTIHILNSAGTEVGTTTFGAVQGGRQSFNLGNATKGLPDGTYTYSIDAKDSAGGPVAVQTYTSGRVDGVSTGQNGLVLTAGGLTIPYANVVQITN
jgi:flagellar basal-body rod modification protein FlgD